MITEALLHYFPWMKLLRGRELPRLLAYVFGVLGLMVPFTLWLLERNEITVVIIMWKLITAGGVSVVALYGLDHYIELTWRDIEASEREQVLRESHGKEG